MIRYRDCRLAPLAGLLSNFRDGIGSIHLTHLCVGVQFNPLLISWCLVLTFLVTHLVDIIGIDHQVVHPGIFLDRPPDFKPHPRFNVCKLGFFIAIPGEFLHGKG